MIHYPGSEDSVVYHAQAHVLTTWKGDPPRTLWVTFPPVGAALSALQCACVSVPEDQEPHFVLYLGQADSSKAFPVFREIGFGALAGERIAIAGLLAGPTAHSAAVGGAPTGPETSDIVSQIAVQHFPGGWGVGPSYTITLERNGPARFEGVQEAQRIGRYTAALSGPTFDSLVTYLLAQPFLNSTQHSTNSAVLIAPPDPHPRGDGCIDLPAVSVTLIVRGQNRTLVDDCMDTIFLARYITPIETLSERLAWEAP